MKGRKMAKNPRPVQATRPQPLDSAVPDSRGPLSERLRNSFQDTAARAYRGENSGLLLLVMVIVVVVFAILLRETTFLSWSNLVSIVETTTAVTVMAVPTVFVICSGEIDLSFNAVVPVSAYIAAVFLSHNIPLPVAVITALAFGVGVGLINGLVTVIFRIPSFVVTLGMLGILQGYSQVITNSATITVPNQTFLKIFGEGSAGPVNVLVIWAVAAVAVGGFILAYTPTGRHVLATGANPAAARFSGIKTGRIKVIVLMFSGLGGALGGLLYLGQYTSATYTMGSSDLLNVLAAVIVGGTVLAGGKGSVVGAFIGSLLIGLIGNALIILGLATPEQLMVRGLIIVLAVILSSQALGRGRDRTPAFLRRLGLVAAAPAAGGAALPDAGPAAARQPGDSPAKEQGE